MQNPLSNNPPDVTLELTTREAEFLLANCNKNMGMGLQLLQNVGDEQTALRVVEMLENFKGIREKLIAQNVKEE
ncbi:hypothetical protein [Synechococcus phage Ssp-JY38]|nr:hypothetical protein [Synechococcus phage Yong-L2-223]